MVRFIARHRYFFMALIFIVIVFGIIFLAKKTNDIKVGNYDSETYYSTAFGTSVKKTLYYSDKQNSDEINNRIDDILKDLDEHLSYRNEKSEVYLANKTYGLNGVTKLSDDITGYLNRELTISKETGGAFSPCILPLSRLWGIEDGYSKPPTEVEIKETLEHTDPDDIEYTGDGFVFHNDGMAIDFGAVGKGAAADEVLKELEGSSIYGAVVSIGGTIALYGDKGADKMWHVGIQDPRDEDGKVLGVLEVSGGNVVSTSGDYEKYFEIGGRRYHHIFDPATGYPVNNGLISVTICSDDGFLSDALSTACFVMGLDEGMAYAREKGADAIFVTSDKKVYITDGLKKRFNIRADGYELQK